MTGRRPSPIFASALRGAFLLRGGYATITPHCASGAPNAWRVWLALKHKGVPYDLKTLSFDAGDLKTPDFPGPEPAPPGAGAVVDGFALYAIVDYVEDRRIFRDLRQRAVQRRLSRGADQYGHGAWAR